MRNLGLSYSELIKLPTYEERIKYLKLPGDIGALTFGGQRGLNQKFYRSTIWKKVRDSVIVRDLGNDMGLDGYPIYGKIIVHHINPIDASDLAEHRIKLLDPDNLICVSIDTHNRIHYGEAEDFSKIADRSPNDTCPWKDVDDNAI